MVPRKERKIACKGKPIRPAEQSLYGREQDSSEGRENRRKGKKRMRQANILGKEREKQDKNCCDTKKKRNFSR